MAKSALILAFLLLAPEFLAQVLTSQYDNARTGATSTEKTLTPANVNSKQFGKIFSLRVEGDVYAQPLFLPGVAIPGKGTHNVVYIATEHDSVYAFEADGRQGEPLWRANFLKSGVSTVPASDVSCHFIDPEIGITPTPVIDQNSGTLYVLARTRVSNGLLKASRYVQTLHALAVTTGVEKFGGPVEIRTPGFNSRTQLPRAALLLANGQVYLTWASSCDVHPYHGWVMAYDAHTLAQTAVFNTSPVAGESGIWQADMGPAADDEGNVYVATGNGRFSTASPGGPGLDYGDSVLKLATQGHELPVRDFFTPFNEKRLNETDADLGCGGPMLLPDQPGEHPHMLLIAAKDGVLYLIDRDRMRSNNPGSSRHEIQAYRFLGEACASPAYWNGHIYFLAHHDYLADFAVSRGRVSEHPVASGRLRFENAAATPAISAAGNRDGIVWLIDTKAWNGDDRPAVLHAFDAANVARELYNSEENGARDRAGLTLRFTVPTVANGRVYVGAKGEVDVYGLNPKSETAS